jgi:hypothetical protein
MHVSAAHTHSNGDWTKVGAIACCEVGGLVNASACLFLIGECL